MLCRQQNQCSQGWGCALCLWFPVLDLATTLYLTPPLSLFSQVLLHKDLPQWAAGGKGEEGWVARGRDHLLSPWKKWLNPSWMELWEPQGCANGIAMAGTPLFTPPAFLSAVHAVPGDHRGPEETNLWRLAVGAQWGEDATLAGLALSESQ